jgi:protein-S-isoprenylcysteine O-methyltransferase Ste14
MDERPRRSPESSLLGFLAAVLALVGMFYGRVLFCSNPVVIAVQVLAALLMIWARLTFGLRSFHAAASPTAGGLVSSGPYRYWRHPIYAAILYFTWAAALCHRTPLAWAGATVITLGLALRMAMEERLLRAGMPGYVEYAARTKRVVPFVI